MPLNEIDVNIANGVVNDLARNDDFSRYNDIETIYG